MQLMNHVNTLEIVEYIAGYILLTVGMLRLFDKCSLERKWAYIPVYRIYKLAEYAGREDDGKMAAMCMLATHVLSGLMGYTNRHISHITSIVYLLLLFRMVASIMDTIYLFRIYAEMCKIFGRKKRWVILWYVCDWIPAIIWGYSEQFQPVNKKVRKAAAGLSGIEAELLDEGLTINIEDRTIKTFTKKIRLLKDIHLNIKPGHMVLLLGGSGAGKTTFINAVTGYEQANAEIFLNGKDVYQEFDTLKYDIGVVPQQDLIRYDDTVENTLSDMAMLRLPSEVSAKERQERVKEVLDIFGLAPVKDNLVRKQSGGQKKRISIASEFISDPYLFILDEPDSGLDGILARELMQRLHDISREGKIVIVITHSPDRVIDLFDDLIVLAKDRDRTGRLVFYGSIEESKEFFGTDKMENVVRMINRKEEGGLGKADEFIEKYAEVCHE